MTPIGPLGAADLPVPPVSPAQLLVAGRLGLLATALGTEVRVDRVPADVPVAVVRRRRTLDGAVALHPDIQSEDVLIEVA